MPIMIIIRKTGIYYMYLKFALQTDFYKSVRFKTKLFFRDT